MKRFWKEVQLVDDDGGWRIELDGRPVRTPARALLLLPNRALADAAAAEWRAAGETVDPRAMPMTGLANSALDRVAPQRETFADGLARYASGDLFCYRAESPSALIDAQAAEWDPLLQWARRRYDVDFAVTGGVAPVDQPEATVERLTHAVRALGPFQLAGLSPMVTVGGSLVAALAVFEEAIGVYEAWSAVSLDERWQLDQWGSDAEAEKALDAREADFRAGARLLELLRS
ncbi:ATP12 family chaperone protein [Sphingomonas sp. LHG3406-1]|uniref:ATP12 family chaperone protein n=1 Tax=Sphingomonas sp. LHG3406-1 TaxID=2804617 RepID=UPI002631DBE6|nr:ATP12 family protein [Sphingomonas sp. LHG3406-1]